MVSPGDSSVPANKLPIITQDAPAASALEMSPEYLIPPSAMSGTFVPCAARAASIMAVNCGTPAPVTTRVVQIDPGPMPTFKPSTPSEINSFVPSYVATFPAMICASGRRWRMALIASITRKECPWAVSIASTSTFVFVFRCARILQLFLDVFHGDQALQIKVLIDDEQFLDAVFLQNALRFVQGGAHGHGH